MLLARAAVVLACAVAVVAFAHRRADARACAKAQTTLFSAGLRHEAPPATVRRLVDTCRDAEDIAVASAGVASGGHPEVAVTLARVAVRREPDGFAGWAALAQALRTTNPPAAARTTRRAQELNPRWKAPRARSAPVSAAPATAAP